MRRGAAWGIVGAAWLVAATGVGATIRGPHAGGGLAHDAAVGAAVLGFGAALSWAARELADPDEAGQLGQQH